ncbi:YggT family protein [Lacticigenium naphthae]|uniref:YggT family protein n=1 Tax=Lacticigenium naphthae TaxID=515351 RepID=UPI00048787A5|nr:YggT family protein [Lacticigenium naphthae]
MVSFLSILYRVLSQGIDIYQMLLVVYFLLSWLPGAYNSKLGQILIRICEPYVGYFRKIVPPIGMISLAGIASYFFLDLVDRGLLGIFRIIISLF